MLEITGVTYLLLYFMLTTFILGWQSIKDKQMLTTTLKDIRAKLPCQDGWETLIEHLGKTSAEAKVDETPLGFDVILESNGLGDALWCLRALPKSMDSECRLLACDFSESVLKYVKDGDESPAKAIAAARLYAAGKASLEDLSAAYAAVAADDAELIKIFEAWLSRQGDV